MQNLDPKVVVLFFIRNLLGTVYVLPLWFLGVFIFGKIWVSSSSALSEDVILLILDGAGIIFFALLIFASYIWSMLSFVHFGYDMQPDGLHIRKGPLLQRHLIIPYSDIETVDVLLNPLVVRTLNLYAIRIQTRQLENTTGLLKKKQIHIIPGLTSETARNLRASLFQGIHIQKVKKTYFDPISGNYR